ncbi:MAG: protein kinase domain-containing protein [Blastocatellia bacterium]
MNPERWRRIDELFGAVADLPPAEREAQLTRICGDDEELRREVLELLAHEPPDSFLHDPIKHAALAVTNEPADELLGQRIGPYRLTRLIGRGGMGAVYEAVRDDEQFQQQVALKLIKRGMDSDFVRERFMRERQILASLDHPHIARLFDGGTTADGLPYFVMEFVAGEPITEYCRRRELSLAAKLKLFRDVCSALQHAHQKLAVHRDLKPSNILVTSTPDGKGGAPKLLDFGIAKLLAPDPGEAVTRTETAVRLMTPDYASPEQVRGGAITTATDVYALGVVLYELLTGRRPYQFETYAPLEVERTICETEAPRPSDVVRGMRDEGGGMKAKARNLFSSLIPHPSSLLRGDLDNIVLMALRKEPARRYQSVEQFSEDLRRYLTGLPVTARPDTFVYRASKFAQRHRVAVVAAALVLLSLLGGILATTLAARQARAERAHAERRFAQVRKLSNTFLFDFYDKVLELPGSTEAREMVVKTALEYLDSLAQEAGGDPALQLELAQAYLRVGDVQGDLRAANLGQIKASTASYRKGLALAEKLEAGSPDNTALFRTLTDLHINLGVQQSINGDAAGGIAELRQALGAAERINARNPHKLEHLIMLDRSYEALGDAQLQTRNVAAALDSFRRSWQLSERRAAEFPSDSAQHSLALTLSRLGDALAEQGDLMAAVESYRRALPIRETLNRKLPDNAVYRRELRVFYSWLANFLGNPYFLNLGAGGEALQYYLRAVKIAEELAQADPKNSAAQFDLVVAYERLGDILSETEPKRGADFYRQALSLSERLLAASPNQYRFLRRHAVFQSKLGAALRGLGDRQAAFAHLRQALEELQKLLAEKPSNAELQSDLHATLISLADALIETGERAEALERDAQALALAEKMVAANRADLYAQWRLANSYSGFGRHYAALAFNQKSRAAERIANWRQARDWHWKALGVWDDWSQRAVSSSFNLTRREQAARALAACDAALAKLSGAPFRQ